MRTLVVEDDPRTRRALAELLAELGHEAVEAGSVAEGVAAFRRSAPDVAIVDLGLPDGDGLDLVRGAPAGTAVLVLTGQGSVRNAVEAMKAGAHDFFVKPLRPPQLRAALDHLGARPSRAPAPPERAAEESPAREGLGELLGQLAADAGGDAPPHPRRRLGRPGLSLRRERDRQGGGRADPPRAVRGGPRDPSSA